MAQFAVMVTATATIRETWLVEAESAADAQDRFERRDELEHAGIQHHSDEVVGDEHDRVVERVEPMAWDGGA